MPLTAKGEDILAAMKKQYGSEKGEEVFYAAKNAGTITGVDSDEGPMIDIRGKGPTTILDSVAEQINKLKQRMDAAQRYVVTCEMADPNHSGTGRNAWLSRSVGLNASSQSEAETKAVDFYKKKGMKNVKVHSVRSDNVDVDRKIDCLT